eukprot:scaffold11069_cov36-Tisochrysis_lutea.AAC.2
MPSARTAAQRSWLTLLYGLTPCMLCTPTSSGRTRGAKAERAVSVCAARCSDISGALLPSGPSNCGCAAGTTMPLERARVCAGLRASGSTGPAPTGAVSSRDGRLAGGRLFGRSARKMEGELAPSPRGP